MSRYSSLCIFFALFGSIVATGEKDKGKEPCSDEGCSPGPSSGLGRSLSNVKNLVTKLGEELEVSALGSKLALPSEKSKWEDVMFSETGDEKGMLIVTENKSTVYYNFHPYSTLQRKSDSEVAPSYWFQQDAIIISTVTWDRTVVKFKLRSDDEFTLTFACVNDALAFINRIK